MTTKNDHDVKVGSDQEKGPKFDPNVDKAPDGGLRAWMVALGGGCIFFCCLGFVNAYGVFQEYYMTHQLRGDSIDKIAWIGSVASFMQFSTGVVGGPLFDRYGAWVCPLLQHGGVHTRYTTVHVQIRQY